MAAVLSPRVVEQADYWVLKDPASGSPHGRLYIPRHKGWRFNGNFSQPTFAPSVKETWDTPERVPQCNHFIVTDGKVLYCGDCTHAFAGRTVDLPEFSEAEVEAAKD